MKQLSLLIWISQLGLSVALPLAGFIWLAVWLHNDCGWGTWIIWVGAGLGLVCAAEGFRSSLRTLYLLTKDKNDTQAPSFNEHD